MKTFLGEFPVDIASSKFRFYTPGSWALTFIEHYGGIDGAHHKDWVLDQVARCLNGVPIIVVEARWDNGESEFRFATAPEGSDAYKDWVKSMRGEFKDGEYEYDYNVGTPP